MIRLYREKVMALHQIISDATGGDPGLREMGLLDSALESAFQTFGGVELYPTIPEKAARIGYSLIANHAFVDGNKRIGMFILLIFLEINGVHIDPTNEEITRVGLGVAAGQMSYEELLRWVLDNQ